MLLGKYLFSCEFQTDAVLPEYKGSSFRGVFGHALKKVVCALKRQECADCLLLTKCIYPFIFEGIPETGEHQGRKRIAAPPHPYVIEPPIDSKTHYQKGDDFDFSLILFGKANDYLPYFIYAFEQMGYLGIGKSINGERASFCLKSVHSGNRPVFTSDDKKIRMDIKPQLVDIGNWDILERCSVVDVVLQTPLRLKYENHLEADLPFHILTRAMLRRVSSLFHYYGNGEPPLDYRGLVERSKSVEQMESTLRWFDWRRYSNRQDRSMLMGGILGNVVYKGDLGEFIPLLRFCEEAHLGKQTTFGLGKISVMVPQ